MKPIAFLSLSYRIFCFCSITFIICSYYPLQLTVFYIWFLILSFCDPTFLVFTFVVILFPSHFAPARWVFIHSVPAVAIGYVVVWSVCSCVHHSATTMMHHLQCALSLPIAPSHPLYYSPHFRVVLVPLAPTWQPLLPHVTTIHMPKSETHTTNIVCDYVPALASVIVYTFRLPIIA